MLVSVPFTPEASSLFARGLYSHRRGSKDVDESPRTVKYSKSFATCVRILGLSAVCGSRLTASLASVTVWSFLQNTPQKKRIRPGNGRLEYRTFGSFDPLFHSSLVLHLRTTLLVRPRGTLTPSEVTKDWEDPDRRSL